MEQITEAASRTEPGHRLATWLQVGIGVAALFLGWISLDDAKRKEIVDLVRTAVSSLTPEAPSAPAPKVERKAPSESERMRGEERGRVSESPPASIGEAYAPQLKDGYYHYGKLAIPPGRINQRFPGTLPTDKELVAKTFAKVAAESDQEMRQINLPVNKKPRAERIDLRVRDISSAIYDKEVFLRAAREEEIARGLKGKTLSVEDETALVEAMAARGLRAVAGVPLVD